MTFDKQDIKYLQSFHERLPKAQHSKTSQKSIMSFWLSLLVLSRSWQASVVLNAGFSWALYGVAEVGRFQRVLLVWVADRGVGRCKGAAPGLGAYGVTRRRCQVSSSIAAVVTAQTFSDCLYLLLLC